MAFADLSSHLLSLMGMEAQIPASVQTHNWGPLLLNEEIQTPEELSSLITSACLRILLPADAASAPHATRM